VRSSTRSPSTSERFNHRERPLCSTNTWLRQRSGMSPDAPEA
jgi:hypothetical protein